MWWLILHMTCPHCSHIVATPRSTRGAARAMLPGAVYLCPQCGDISIVDSVPNSFVPPNLRKMTDKEFLSLDAQTRNDLIFAAKCILGKARKDGHIPS